ncbi:MAG: CorA family divalent cation transporter [Pirellulales bacterium]
MKPESTLLPAEWNVPDEFRQRLGESAGRQRLMQADGQLLLVLHAPPAADEAGRRGRFFWRDPGGNWKAAPRAEETSSLVEHLAEYRTTIENLEQREEAAQSAREYFEVIDQVTPLTRAARNLLDVLQKAREAKPDDRRLIVARDEAYDVSRRADLLYDDAKNGLEFAIARQAEAQTESSRQMMVAAHRLNVLVALFFPIATLTGMFGMSFRHGLEIYDALWAPWLFIGVTIAGLLMGIVITSIITRLAPRSGSTSALYRPRPRDAD